MVDVLDQTQLRRIEAMHRGFLFQHLFAVACILRRSEDLTAIAVERDEDVELLAPDIRKYVQVKTRSGMLTGADLRTTLERFRELRRLHENGSRDGRAQFWIVTNTTVSEGIAQDLASEDFHLFGPGMTNAPGEDALPGPWRDIEEALRECVAAASTVPFTTLQPQTLVWKLAAVVAHASTGGPSHHTISSAELPSLCEQFIDQLHTMPEAPTPYRAQEDEPQLESGERVLLVVALSGGGKSAWIAEGSLHATQPIVYGDAAGLPDSAVPAAILREAAASLRHTLKLDISTILMPGTGSLDGLRGLSRIVGKSTYRPTIILDNAHMMSPETVRGMVQATPNFSWVLLAQPWPGIPLLEAYFGVHAHHLSGWSLETIASAFKDAGAPITLTDARRIVRLTGGLPLFVIGAAKTTATSYSGNAQAFCWDIELATSTHTTPQAAILAAIINRLSDDAKRAASLLLLAEVPITAAEARQLLIQALSLTPSAAAALIRELHSWGLIQVRVAGTVTIHDAFRPAAVELQGLAGPVVLHKGRSALADLYNASFGPGQMDRLVSFCKLLRPLGRTAELPGIMSSLSEHLYELGRASELLNLLIETANDPAVAVPDRFLAADTAVFWMHQNDDPRYEELLHLMAKLAEEGCLELDDVARLAIKEMTFAAERADQEGIEKEFSAALKYAQREPLVLRILRYNYAVAQFKLQRYEQARVIARNLAGEYEQIFGISYAQGIHGKNPPEIAETIGEKREDIEGLKRFADLLDLEARILQKLQQPAANLFLNAHKLYLLANAPISAIKAGLEYVYDVIELGAFRQARQFMEGSLIPLVQHHKLLGHVVSVQSQYAVVLAYDGEIVAARKLLTNMSEIVGPEHAEELAFRTSIVERIANGQIRFRSQASLGQQHPVVLPYTRIRRNDLCPCGSGIQYKKCCGR
jgi:hypothetical protein